MSAVILVEGESDKAAVEALAERLGRDLESEGVSVRSLGGASSIRNVLIETLETVPPDTKLAGLCDEAEADEFCRALEASGLGDDLSTTDMGRLGFFVCRRDLEDELLRALDIRSIERILIEQGELAKFRKFQVQPQWRGRPLMDQIHRFTGIKSGRKIRYGRVLVEALDLDHLPYPLEQLLAHVRSPGAGN